MKVYKSKKCYTHEMGFSVAFRQWRAVHSHCSKMHGYALAVEIEFATHKLDERMWVVDFGAMDGFKKELQFLFDHRTVVAEDDPDMDFFVLGEQRGVFDLTILPDVGCERFAEHIFEMAEEWLNKEGISARVWVDSVTVREHGANSATVTAKNRQ